MTHGTDKPPEQPSPSTPPLQPNRIVAEPATPEACRADYDAGADIRARLGWKDAN